MHSADLLTCLPHKNTFPFHHLDDTMSDFCIFGQSGFAPFCEQSETKAALKVIFNQKETPLFGLAKETSEQGQQREKCEIRNYSQQQVQELKLPFVDNRTNLHISENIKQTNFVL